MRNILICVDLQNQDEASLKNYFERINTKTVDEVLFVHAYQTQVYADNFNVTTYPNQDEFKKISNEIETLLENMSKSVLPKDFSGKVLTKTILSTSPKIEILKMAKAQNIDEMVITTRGLHGLEGVFHSSFADFMMRHSQSELTILRAPNN